MVLSTDIFSTTVEIQRVTETPSVRQSAITTHGESELMVTNKQPSLIAVNTTGRYKK